ncbi:hypothetical protein F5Y11DRAFT_346774 [Daldinia sp. FL1419]|nr:hypothetical protein F5Y11DRAFT_346774 [Daldinia sp. FL1419]
MEDFDLQARDPNFRMEDFDPHESDFESEMGGFDFSDIDNRVDDDPSILDTPRNQPDRETTVEPTPEADPNTPPSPDHQLFVNQFEWAENNLPIGVSFDSDIPMVTPAFLDGWTYQPEQHAERPEDENQGVLVGSRGTGYRSEMAIPDELPEDKPKVRRSSRHLILPRVPFPSQRPARAMLATDFKLVSIIPDDVALWCPCCTQILPKINFRITSKSLFPVETCIDCRKGYSTPPNGLTICWGAASGVRGCGRLLPQANFSISHKQKVFTRVLCQDCRTFGSDRARLGGKYIETSP